MKNTLTFGDVEEMLRNGEFENKITYPTVAPLKDSYIFDENQSVKWNRKQVETHNADVKRQKEEYNSGERKTYNLFAESLKAAIAYDTGLSLEKAGIIYMKAYDDGYSDGYRSVITHASDLCDFVTELMK